MLTVNNPGGTGANLRKLPESNSEIIQTAANGEKVTVLSVKDDGWLQIMYENEIGYSRGELFSAQLSFH